MNRDIQYLMIPEMDKDEFLEFERGWKAAWGKYADHMFDQYMEQEGYTGRDEGIAIYRDTLWEQNKERVKDGRVEDIIVDADHGHVMFGTRLLNEYWIWDLAGTPLRRITDPVNYLRLWSHECKAKRLQGRLDARDSKQPSQQDPLQR